MSDSPYIQVGRQTLHQTWRPSSVHRFITRHLIAPISVLADQARQAARLFTGSWDKFAFRQFWGESVSSGSMYLVLDSYENVVLRNRFRWADSAHRDTADNSRGEVVQGTFSPQATGLLTALFLRHTGKGLRIVTDVEDAQKRDGALICYGSSDSNFKTFELEAESGGFLCQFTFNDRGERAFRVGGNLYSIETRDGITYDKAIVLRLAGQQDSGQCRVVCAGLTEWGSLAAVHYLVNNWKTLHRRFDGFGERRDFCILLELPLGHYEHVRERVSAVWWHGNGA